MKLNHRQLDAFRAMIETNSVTEAARRILVSQPAASRLISDLEHQVGYPLFVRSKKRLTPTPEALTLFEEVERSFIGLETIAEAAREIGTYRRGTLHIAGMPAMALEFLPSIIGSFCQERPDISVALQIRSSQKVAECIASQQYDLGFAEISVNHPSVASELLLTAAQVAILPRDHPLSKKEVLTPADMHGEPFISLGMGYPTRQKIDAVFEAAGVDRKLQVETQLSLAAGHLVASGTGIALIDPITAAHLERLNLVTIRPFTPKILYSYQALYPKHKPVSRIARQFMEIVGKRLDEFRE
ncbi:MAG: LysR family transcriptional regulator [Roseibium sp.]|uniref:LysR substrate-binding domain-containing protein n=1 Tax=Roseibium sp. TaxID=1936156 RepID=UPI0026150502|nr:LysR substrate-binding domain-containing protein [Roseibium sp.]MCV0427217.1 LysR family transcriptional regulator [Roseibium sp.]